MVRESPFIYCAENRAQNKKNKYCSYYEIDENYHLKKYNHLDLMVPNKTLTFSRNGYYCIEYKKNLKLGNNVFIGHYNFIEASNGITIEEGCQITNFISITTHSSHISIRLYVLILQKI